MIQVKAYSERGLVVKGASAEQAESIRAGLGANVVAQHNAKLGGWVFSRKREDRIRELVKGMQCFKKDATGTPEGNALLAKMNAMVCGCGNWKEPSAKVCGECQTRETPKADDSLPGKWGPLAG